MTGSLAGGCIKAGAAPPCQLWVALKFSIAYLLPAAWTARLVRSAGPSRRLGMAARASIIPQSGQMSVALSLRERAGGSV